MKKKYPYLVGLPDCEQNHRIVHSLMFYGLVKPLNERWIEIIESFFEQHGQSPDQLIVNSDTIQGNGGYRRVKNKLTAALIEASQEKEIDLRVRSQECVMDDGFMPCDIEVAISTNKSGVTQGVFSVDSCLAPNLNQFAKLLAMNIENLGGQFYGHASKFPALYGPESYLACVGTIPRGHNFMETRAHTKRITSWRENIRSKSTDPKNGFFREIYPINFLTQQHLEKTINNMSASHFFKKYGILEELRRNTDMFVWSLKERGRKKAALVLKKEGLVLSSNG